MNLRLLATGIVLLTASAPIVVAAADDEPAFAERSQKYEKDIAAFNAIDPSFPMTILARLDYATDLSKQRQDHCQANLAKADDQRRQIEADPAATLLLPDLPPRLAYLRYSIAASRAACAANKALKRQWQQTARAETAAAIPLYLAIHQYLDMATAQFNLAEMDLELGNHDIAVEELQEALRLDERYGLRDDAEENLTYLARWQNREPGNGEIADLLNRFSDRVIAPRFEWTSATGHWTEDLTDSFLRAGKLTHGSTHTAGTEAVTQAGEDLLQRTTVTETRVATTGSEQIPDLDTKLSAALEKILTNLPALRLSQDGGFKGIDHLDEFTAQAAAAVRALPAQLVPDDDSKRTQIERVGEQWINSSLTTAALTESAREETVVDIGVWNNLALTQGVWRNQSARLGMPGIPQRFVEQDLRVVFSDRVPCTTADGSRRCVELLLFADPVESAVQEVREELAQKGTGNLTYWGSTRIRLVVDPTTLTSYERETARYSYLSVGSGDQRRTEIKSHLSLTTIRHDP